LLNEVNSYGHLASFLGKAHLKELKTSRIRLKKLPKLNLKTSFATKKTALLKGGMIAMGKIGLKSDLLALQA
jgi:hypothetical protein